MQKIPMFACRPELGNSLVVLNMASKICACRMSSISAPPPPLLKPIVASKPCKNHKDPQIPKFPLESITSPIESYHPVLGGNDY